MREQTDVGVVGMAVMGQNLVLNIERNGYSVAAYNRTAERTREFVEGRGRGKRIVPTYDVEGFVEALSRPRRILLMVKASGPTDAVLEAIFPLLEPGDVVMDGGNAHYLDTERRFEAANERNLFYLGVGISGGESGALHGPAIMAGGSQEAYAAVASILESIAAQGRKGACCAYFGPASAGHYVKMVHNGIEYAIMESLAEAYDLMQRGLGLRAREIADVVGGWNEGELKGYLVEITEKVLRREDPETGKALVDVILDTAAQKGTGKWSTQSALDIGAPSPTIAAAVFARVLSSLKGERTAAHAVLSGPPTSLAGERTAAVDDVKSAVLVAVLAAYAQGFRQLRDASAERGYGLNLAEVARVWTAGCIVRADLLHPISEAFLAQPDLPLLFLIEPFRSLWEEHQARLRRTVVRAREGGIPVPAMSSTLDFVDAYRTDRLPANLLQAQRDFFGAHTYRRVDREGTFHTEWEAPE